MHHMLHAGQNQTVHTGRFHGNTRSNGCEHNSSLAVCADVGGSPWTSGMQCTLQCDWAPT